MLGRKRAGTNAKILSLIATNIRYLDNTRDMAEELFDGHIASGTCPEVCDDGLSVSKRAGKISNQNRQSAFCRVQNVNQKYMDVLCRALETDWTRFLTIIAQTEAESTSCSVQIRSIWMR